ncbi:hypothetical protein BVC80_8755g19 [Macleaya cordata]|uniref:Uncharacterized protein n=1 Tax=Macleaya cordata TaxID=56857 RepID=A0A200PXM1_MACCD|nr:hypothetical protein BVC80_8755g19 [Macleaya cordata]
MTPFLDKFFPEVYRKDIRGSTNSAANHSILPQTLRSKDLYASWWYNFTPRSQARLRGQASKAAASGPQIFGAP